MRFQLPSWVQGKLRRRVTALASGMALAAASLVVATPAQAQSTWNGVSNDYNLSTNWTPATAPVAAGQSAIFGATAITVVDVSAGPITPSSWTFTSNASFYSIFDKAVNFSLAGPAGGIISNANTGQTIAINNNIGESVAGVQVQLLGQSTLKLTGINTYSGGTTVSGFGTLQVGTNGAVGSGTVMLQDGAFQAEGLSDLTFANNFKINGTVGGSFIDSHSVVLTLAGNITDGNGPGALTVVDTLGSGRVILTGTNTYTGGTTICACGTLQLGDATHTGSIVGAVLNEGRFNIVNANTAGITSITNIGGFTSFFGSNTAGTATIVNDLGETGFFNNSTAGSANITNRGGGATIFGTPGGTDTSTAGNATIDNGGGSATIFNAASNAGAAHITNHNFGMTDFGDSSSAGSAIIINNFHGITNFGHSGGTDTVTAANAMITNNSGGETIFNAFSTAGNAIITTNSGAATFFFDNSTGGSAQFITNGTGFVDFSGSIGPNGDGRITAGSIAGSGFYYIGAGNTLIVGSNNLSTEVSGVIADTCGCGPGGPGALTKVGTGILTLSGINTYTGPTVVDGGILSVNGSIVSSSSVTVNAGGTLGGNGIVGNTTINGGTLSPGNSVGLLTVQGSLVFTAASTYLVEVSTTADRTNVTGTATLGGASVNAMLLGGNILKQYTILNATGGVSGTFNPLVNVNVPNVVGSLTYDPNDVFLNFSLNFNPPGGLNANQRNVANALTNFFNANGGIPLVFGALTPAGLSQVSGETATGSQQATFEAMNLFMGLLTDPFIDGRGGSGPPSGGAAPFADESDAIAYAAKRKDAARDAFAKIPTKAEVARNNLLDPHWSVWGAAYGGGATTDGNAALGSNSATARAFGFVAGADYRISPATLVGFALAGGGTNFSVNGFGTGRSDLFQAGAFVRHNIGAAYVSGALAYGWQDVTTDRMVTVAGLDRLHAEFNANAYSGRIEGGYRYLTPWMGVTPYAAGQFTTYSLPAYAEQVLAGANTFALNYSAKDVTASRSELGVRTDRSFAMQNAILTLRGRFAWAHDFNTDRNISAVFQTLPGAAFVVNGAAQSHDSALTTASAEVKWLNGWSAAVAFEGEFSDVTKSYAGKGVVRYTW
ncbi:autotransporter-associated beta strand repeat-containing protein [Bradyrhizobium lablabi]|uniref:Autotransporter-associated beta strand repeat-containing protein n=1 Tax=Bradyrhizobium lablabi TaxID=722472 RepID=A0A1M6M8G9_9BRAD|nr:autotransporter outer membrane beta-barrel domain-containing protein [Bradyrhizobium lablabi]SHJ79732.1 autotransporter-associated beta strand repeat-containing protein [Bradyrhizobium lablabi]